MRLAVNYMVRREAVCERSKRRSVTGESDYIVVRRIFNDRSSFCRIKHTYFGSESLRKRFVTFNLVFAREEQYFFLYFFGNFGCKRVYFFGCVCGIENSVIFKEYYLRSFSVCFFVFAELLAAERCENVSRFC